jgi:hypothetical protein
LNQFFQKPHKSQFYQNWVFDVNHFILCKHTFCEKKLLFQWFAQPWEATEYSVSGRNPISHRPCRIATRCAAVIDHSLGGKAGSILLHLTVRMASGGSSDEVNSNLKRKARKKRVSVEIKKARVKGTEYTHNCFFFSETP